MKTRKRNKKTLLLKIQIHNGRISIELGLPTIWLIPFVTIIGSLLSPTPIINLLATLLNLGK